MKEVEYNGFTYEVTEDGRCFIPQRESNYFREGTPVKRIKKRRESKYNKQKNGYWKCAAGLVHRAVAKAYLEEPEHPSYTVNHKDGNKDNNHYTNLEWVSHSDNVKHWIYSKNGVGVKTHPIEVFDKDGFSVGVWESKQGAANDLGLHKTSITAVLKGKFKTTGGYTFKMITKEEYYAKTISKGYGRRDYRD